MSSSSFLDAQRAARGVPLDESPPVSRTYGFCQPSMWHFGDARREFDAAESDAVMFDVSDRVQIELAGRDAQSFLHKFCTNDVARLAPGDGCEALATNIKGRIVAHLFVFVTDGAVWLETTPGAEEGLLSHFDRYLFSDDVHLHGRTTEFGQLFVTGNGGSKRLSSLGIETATLDNLPHAAVERDSGKFVIRRVDLFLQPGYLLSIERTKLIGLWNELLPAGILPGGAQAFHARRIEARFPLYGLDLGDENLAQEAARTTQAISFTKGCYLGQEPIARIDALGHTNRELRGLKCAGGAMPEPGSHIVAEDNLEVGAITSSAMIPGSDMMVALGMVRTSHTQPGTTVAIRCGNQDVPAEVF